MAIAGSQFTVNQAIGQAFALAGSRFDQKLAKFQLCDVLELFNDAQKPPLFSTMACHLSKEIPSGGAYTAAARQCSHVHLLDIS